MIRTQPTHSVAVRYVDGADPAIPLPSYQSSEASGMDVCANLRPDQREDGVTIDPGARALVSTGLSVALPAGFELQVRPRSGLALKHGVTVLNAPGTIDADYRGEIGVILANFGAEPYIVGHGDRIAQFVLAPVSHATWAPVRALETSRRGSGGFGSTGR